jgi:branched-subunit amino acid ABC-type transport system permease component
VNLFAYLVVGITTGSIYGLAAVGLVLTYRTSGAFNFAHGAVAAAAAFLFYELHVTRRSPPRRS